MDREKLSAKEIELIKEWRAECENRWTPHASPNAMNRREAIIYDRCADQLEKLVGEVSEKSSKHTMTNCRQCGGSGWLPGERCCPECNPDGSWRRI